jgi:hypothetical protein
MNKQGAGSAYLLRRIARMKDGEAILERYDRGEFKSVRAAADAAGIPRDTTLAELRRAWRRASENEKNAFLAELQR